MRAEQGLTIQTCLRHSIENQAHVFRERRFNSRLNESAHSSISVGLHQEVFIPNLLDFECYKTAFIYEHCEVLPAAFCDSTAIMEYSIQEENVRLDFHFVSLFFCFDATYILHRHKCPQRRDAC